MYNPPAFAVADLIEIRAMIRACPLANFVTATADGPIATPLPMFLDESEGEMGTLYAHLAKPNPQWKTQAFGDGLAIFMGPDAYVSPAWYASKAEHGRVVPTWNYVTVQARGPVEFFEDAARLLDVVSRLTDLHEKDRATVWSVTDAPEAYVAGQLRGIVGLRMPITALTAKRKMSQNRNQADRAGVKQGLSDSGQAADVAALIEG